jgi:hypothetical protein
MFMDTCIACSMPLMHAEDRGNETKDGPVCIHCSRPGGGVKSCEEIFNGGVSFFLAATQSRDRALAERLVRKTMHGLPLWKNSTDTCLQGNEASDEEFAAAMATLSSTSH